MPVPSFHSELFPHISEQHQSPVTMETGGYTPLYHHQLTLAIPLQLSAVQQQYWCLGCHGDIKQAQELSLKNWKGRGSKSRHPHKIQIPYKLFCVQRKQWNLNKNKRLAVSIGCTTKSQDNSTRLAGTLLCRGYLRVHVHSPFYYRDSLQVSVHR